VRANKGASDVDGRSIEDFETDLKGNLYKIWNRMSSGSYFPPPVRAVEIPKSHGDGIRVLGVPTVADRIAQTVVAARLESTVEPKFHPDSFGYRSGRSALDAVARCRQRCWSSDWVLDLDIQSFFDSVPWQLIVQAVEANTDQPWVILYVKRWLAAPLQRSDGSQVERVRGTPQGSAVSPVLGQPVPALRVRRVDGSGVPVGVVRAVCRRRGGALPQPRPGTTGGRGDRGAHGTGWAAAAPGQDSDRVLQGRAAVGAPAHRL
jgi:group II intron reverse transcriptase/maturase